MSLAPKGGEVHRPCSMQHKVCAMRRITTAEGLLVLLDLFTGSSPSYAIIQMTTAGDPLALLDLFTGPSNSCAMIQLTSQ